LKQSIAIKEIPAEVTWPLRQSVMWPNKSLDYVKLPLDHQGLHYGLFVEQELYAIVSLFVVDKTAQFRKFATKKTVQGQGYGTQLLGHIMKYAEENEIHRIWCNARVGKTHFYRKFGMTATKNTFSKGGLNYIIMERKFQK